jgi:hypothetical protein
MNTDKTLVIRPIGGLCNRLRAMGTAFEIARWQNRRATVLWHVNDELGARWSDLFEPLEQAALVDIPERGLAGLPLRLRHAYAMLPASRPAAWLAVRLRRGRFDRVFPPGECRSRALEKKGYKDVFSCRALLFVYYDWLVDGQVDFAFLRPRPEIRERINAITTLFGPRAVGVHIRRTDSAEAIRRSPIELFEQRMGELVAADDRTLFYLATDDPAVEKRLAGVFGKRMIPVNRVYGRSGVPGLESAVVDLWCLARTSRVLGSFISSFSETAARIGKVPLAVLDAGGG